MRVSRWLGPRLRLILKDPVVLVGTPRSLRGPSMGLALGPAAEVGLNTAITVMGSGLGVCSGCGERVSG